MNAAVRSLTNPDLRSCFEYCADAPVVWHCHHFNLFLDQIIEDAMGPLGGLKVRVHSALEASYVMLSQAYRLLEIDDAQERVSLAEAIFWELGHGRLDVRLLAEGSEAVGTGLHYSHAWLEKYGATSRRRMPVDTFAAGFATATTTLAQKLPFGYLVGRETECYALRDATCRFTIAPGYDLQEPPLPLGRQQFDRILGPPFVGQQEDSIEAIAGVLRQWFDALRPDENGVIGGFGVVMTRQLAEYYNLVVFTTLYALDATLPALRAPVEDLLRESGQICVFRGFRAVLGSDRYSDAFGEVVHDPHQIVAGCAALARTLGFGRWGIAEFEPGVRLVLRTSGTYESLYHRARHRPPAVGISYFMQGAAWAIMRLAADSDWSALEPGTSVPDTRWAVKQTGCTAMGDEYDEVVVELR